jgi:hypothetical protein
MSKWNHEHTKLWSQQNFFQIFWNKCYGQQKSVSSSSNKYTHQYCKNHIKISKVYTPNFTTLIHKTFKGYKYTSLKIFTLRKKNLTFIWCISKCWFINLNWLHLSNSGKKISLTSILSTCEEPQSQQMDFMPC